MEGKLGTEELAGPLNHLVGGGSRGVRVSGGRTTTGPDLWIVPNFSFSPACSGAVVIRMTICLMLFRLSLDSLVIRGFLSSSFTPTSRSFGKGEGSSSIAARSLSLLIDVVLLLG